MVETGRNPRLEEDLAGRITDAPPSYPDTTEAPVRYVEVDSAYGVAGFLWVSAHGEAIDYLPRRAAGDWGANADTAWIRKLRELCQSGLGASQAFDELLRWKSSGNFVTWPDPATLRTLPGLDALKELAEQV